MEDQIIKDKFQNRIVQDAWEHEGMVFIKVEDMVFVSADDISRKLAEAQTVLRK